MRYPSPFCGSKIDGGRWNEVLIALSLASLHFPVFVFGGMNGVAAPQPNVSACSGWASGGLADVFFLKNLACRVVRFLCMFVSFSIKLARLF